MISNQCQRPASRDVRGTAYDARMRYGFLGTGAITHAMVIGLSEGVTEPPDIVVSPRNAEVAAGLAARFPNVTVAPSNESVVEQSDAVVLAVRPQDAEVALAGLPFREDQPILSAIAGISVEDVAKLVAPATRISRSIPLPELARRSGIVAMYPAEEAAIAFFERIGTVVVTPSEPALDAHSAVTSLVAAHLDYLDAVSEWFAEQGVPPLDARRYVAATFKETVAGLDGDVPFTELADRHATAGGLNEQVRIATSDDVRRITRQALDEVLERISPSDD